MRRSAAFLLLCIGASLAGQQAPDQTCEVPRLRPRTIQTLPEGVIVKRVDPPYPHNASAKALAEGVDVKLTIDKQGVPKDIKVTKGDPALAKAVVEALRQWRWKPYKLNGEAVEVESSVYIRFEPTAKMQ